MPSLQKFQRIWVCRIISKVFRITRSDIDGRVISTPLPALFPTCPRSRGPYGRSGDAVILWQAEGPDPNPTYLRILDISKRRCGVLLNRQQYCMGRSVSRQPVFSLRSENEDPCNQAIGNCTLHPLVNRFSHPKTRVGWYHRRTPIRAPRCTFGGWFGTVFPSG